MNGVSGAQRIWPRLPRRTAFLLGCHTVGDLCCRNVRTIRVPNLPAAYVASVITSGGVGSAGSIKCFPVLALQYLMSLGWVTPSDQLHPLNVT